MRGMFSFVRKGEGEREKVWFCGEETALGWALIS